LSDDEVIRLVSTQFIPVAVNLYQIRKDPGPAGDLFRSVARQMDQYQGFWIVSPEGKALAKYHDWKGDPSVPKEKRVPMILDEGLKAFGPVTPRTVQPTDLLPYRGKGVQPDEKVNVALYGRLMARGKPDGPMMLDSVTYEGAEWAAFAPPAKGKGQEWTLPDKIARNLARSLLSPGDSAGVFPHEDFLKAELRAKVESIEDGKARIRLMGTWKAEGLYGGEKGHPHGASATGDGIAVYDLEKRSMRSLIMILDGQVGKTAEIVKGGRETGGVVEWTCETTEERRKP
jgi:hypothetical protein